MNHKTICAYSSSHQVSGKVSAQFRLFMVRISGEGGYTWNGTSTQTEENGDSFTFGSRNLTVPACQYLNAKLLVSSKKDSTTTYTAQVRPIRKMRCEFVSTGEYQTINQTGAIESGAFTVEKTLKNFSGKIDITDQGKCSGAI
jgi:hypothetical protein